MDVIFNDKIKDKIECILMNLPCVWMMSFTRSIGAVAVLAIAPDTPPALRKAKQDKKTKK